MELESYLSIRKVNIYEFLFMIKFTVSGDSLLLGSYSLFKLTFTSTLFVSTRNGYLDTVPYASTYLFYSLYRHSSPLDQFAAMKTGPSSLNPNAASYVPLFKRGGAGNRPEHTLTQGQHPNISQSHVLSPGATRAAEFAIWKDHRGGEFHASTSQYPNMAPEKSYFDDFDMDLAYLQMTFPGISEQSLSDVYLANICDLDAAVDMIHQLEIQLPETLDIGDVPETGSTSKLEAKVKSPTAEKGASTSR